MNAFNLPRHGDLAAAIEAVEKDPDNLELWEGLIAVVVQYSTRTKHDTEVTASLQNLTRSIFTRVLRKFPLLFGYWIQYAHLEAEFSGIVGAINVYEQAVAAYPLSIDLWTQYGTFLVEIFQRGNTETQQNEQQIEEVLKKVIPLEKVRSIFQRGIEVAGRDFLSHPLWDAYLNFEDSLEKDSLQTAHILKKVIKYPMHQYARYYERCSQLSEKYPEVFQDINLSEIFSSTQTGTNDRWTYESKISRSYFHVVELEPDQISNWNDYLDYEESQGDYEQTRFLYERALVPGALYDKLWLRYARWAAEAADAAAVVTVSKSRNSPLTEEVRNIYRRATSLFVPLSRPYIRIHWSLYEESIGNLTLARDILQSYQNVVSDEFVEEVYYDRIQFERRQSPRGAIDYIDYEFSLISKITSTTASTFRVYKIHPVLIALKAEILWKFLDDVVSAREVLESSSTIDSCLSSSLFFINYFRFELGQARKSSDSEKRIDFLHPLWKLIITKSHLPPIVITDLSEEYLSFLEEVGFLKEYFEVDIETHGPFKVQSLHKEKLGWNTDARLKMSNGHPGVEIDPISVVYERKNPFAKYLAEQEDK